LPKSGAAGRGEGRGFTIIELLVVVAVISLLVSVVVPSIGRARELGHSAVCKSNLRQLHATFHAGFAGEPMLFPPVTGWVSHVCDCRAGSVLRCPKDEDLSSTASFAGLRIDHLHHGQLYEIPLESVLEGVPWFQVVVKEISRNVVEVWVDDDAAIRITFGEVIYIASIDTPGHYACCSDHWLYRGEEELMQLTGRSYHQVDPRSPIELPGIPVSYAMNNQVNRVDSRPGQLLLLGYEKSIADVDGQGNNDDDLDEQLAPRHVGKVNVLMVDGSVHGMWPWEVDRTEDVWKP
jgi:prepilin-type N-terminal cleavage/methylation domain-containing protein/prepilin-type processing-associated H-X9-DG protein